MYIDVYTSCFKRENIKMLYFKKHFFSLRHLMKVMMNVFDEKRMKWETILNLETETKKFCLVFVWVNPNPQTQAGIQKCNFLFISCHVACGDPSSPTRDWTHISCLTGQFFTSEPPGKPPSQGFGQFNSVQLLSLVKV